jgi:hypothetical protein
MNAVRHGRSSAPVTGLMRFLVVAAMVLVAGCAPSALQPALTGVRSLGYACGDGVKDNVPSGLYQWHCSGMVEGNLAVINVDGNANGVAGFTLSINSVDLALMRAEFLSLVTSVSPLTAEPDLAAALDTWTGTQDPKVFGAARVNGECDATQCVVYITSVDGPLQPLRLP